MGPLPLRIASANFTFLQCKFHISPVQISPPSLPARLSNAHAHELHFEQVAGVSACRDIGSGVRTGNPIYYGGPGVQ